MFSHINRDLPIRSKAGRHYCAVLGSWEIDRRKRGRSAPACPATSRACCRLAGMEYSRLDNPLSATNARRSRIYLEDNCRRKSINDSDPPLYGAQSSGLTTWVPATGPWSTRSGVSIAALLERKGNVAHVEKYWLVCFVFSSAFSVLIHAVSGPWQGCLVGEPAQFSFPVLFPSPKRFRFGLYCCRHDFSDFLFVLSLVGGIRSSWVGSNDPSAPVFELGLDSYVHCPRAFPSL